MKKIFLIFLMLAALVSCATEEPILKETQTKTINQEYEEGRQYVQVKIQSYYEAIRNISTRSINNITPSEFLSYILNMPQSQLDSLIALYDTPDIRSRLEYYHDLRDDKLMELSSPEDVAALYAFIREYASSGGNLPTLLENASRQVSPVIKRGMSVSAAGIDEMLTNYPLTRINFACLRDVLIENGFNLAADAILDMAGLAIIEIDPVFSLEDELAGLGLTAAEITLVKVDYERCCMSRIYN